MAELTAIISEVAQGKARPEDLLPEVYNELRRLAAARLKQEPPGQTLQATALVHEAWLRLMEGQPVNWNGRHHFFGAAAQAMRRILVENARRKRRIKRGGELQQVDLEQVEICAPMPDEDLLALDEALQKLAEEDRQAAEVVELCFFGGLTQAQAAEQLRISRATAERDWAFARAWLFKKIRR